MSTEHIHKKIRTDEYDSNAKMREPLARIENIRENSKDDHERNYLKIDEIYNDIISCDVCKMSKHDNTKPPGLMGKYRIAKHPWQMISMDLLDPFPRSRNGNTSLLVVSDWFTKYPCLIPLRNATAKNVVKNVENKIFNEFSVPHSVIMDNGSQFVRSNVFVKKVWNYSSLE